MNIAVIGKNIFDIYCSYVLAQSNAANGRYDVDDLRNQVMLMPHAKITMAALDIMIGQVPILPKDYTFAAWAEDRVIGVAKTETAWASYPFMIARESRGKLSEFGEWRSFEAEYMQQGLEPCLSWCGDEYQFEGVPYYLVDMRFLPLKSYTHSQT